MTYEGEFVEAQFLQRPNRFLSVVRVGDEEERAHLPNPGRINELLLPGARVVLKKEKGEKRKTAYTLILVYKDGFLVSLDTTLPNRLAAEAIDTGKIAEFAGYRVVRREAQYGKSRFDLLLAKGEMSCFVEVKSVSLVRNRVALFPDAPTIRGTKHIHHLMAAMDEGYKAGVFFIVQRHDADIFTSNDQTDPKFAAALRQCQDYGVQLCAYTSRVAIGSMEIDRRIAINL